MAILSGLYSVSLEAGSEHEGAGTHDGGNLEKKMIEWPPDPFLISDVLKLQTLWSSAHTTHTPARLEKHN